MSNTITERVIIYMFACIKKHTLQENSKLKFSFTKLYIKVKERKCREYIADESKIF